MALFTHIYKSAQEGLVFFYITSYRKIILDNMQLQYVYCTCNSNSQSGKAMHSVKQRTSEKHKILEQEWTLKIIKSNSFILQVRKLRLQEVKQLAADPLREFLLVYNVPFLTVSIDLFCNYLH